MVPMAVAVVVAMVAVAVLSAATATVSMMQTSKAGECPHGFYRAASGDICCQQCEAGEYLISDCTAEQGHSGCQICDGGYYTEYPNSSPKCMECSPCESDEEEERQCNTTTNRRCRCKPGYHKPGGEAFCREDSVPSATGGKTAVIAVAVVLLLLFGAAVAAAFIYRTKGGKFPCDGEPGNPDHPRSTASPLLTKNKQNPEAVPSTDGEPGNFDVPDLTASRQDEQQITVSGPSTGQDPINLELNEDNRAIPQEEQVDTMVSPYTLKMIGGQGGNEFSFNWQENVATLQKLSVSVGGCQVRGVEVWLTDRRRKTFGTVNSSAEGFEFKSGEFITSLSLWGNGDGTHLGAIKFRTSHSREFFAKIMDLELKNEYKIDVGSGICLGVQGRAGSDIDSMGFLFINAIKSSVIHEMKYPTMHQVLPNVQTEEINEMQYKNDTSVDQSYTFESSKRITKTSSWSTTNNIEFTFSLMVKAGIPKIVEVGSDISFTVGCERTCKVEESEEKTEMLTFPVSVPPHKTINVVANIGHVKVDLPYTALLRITCVNGAILDAPLNGVYKGLTYTKMAAVASEC
ncbi:aerolysin-like protein isoform X2 [Lethenteron reissneri]|uniref:aerolysin-like protein isoform X2 n=1 Tax=Lethenteron reissneri TaxID=7753 RepID=UPI002AB6CBE2|nr:aerolysin-like protein isoform X2 [Lethenteron reissneri]